MAVWRLVVTDKREVGRINVAFLTELDLSYLQAITAIMSIKLTDVVKRFSGEGDVVAWVEQLELVAQLQASEMDLAKVIPLFLEGAAYDVYAQMDAGDRADATALKRRLRAAFGLSPSLAFNRFKSRTLMQGESPDAFLAELRRLARTVADGGDEETVDQFVLCQFVDGLPEPTRSQVRALKSGGAWSLAAALQCAKSMLLEQVESGTGGGFLGAGEKHAQGGGAGREESRARGGPPRCYGCGRVGHLHAQCRERRCHKCQEVGHIKRDCPTAVQGNGDWGSV